MSKLEEAIDKYCVDNDASYLGTLENPDEHVFRLKSVPVTATNVLQITNLKTQWWIQPEGRFGTFVEYCAIL